MKSKKKSQYNSLIGSKIGKSKRQLGLLEGKAKVAFKDNFKITEEELLNITIS